MRECPKCGYTDPPYWRHVRFTLYTDCCNFEDFEMLHPLLAARLLKEITLKHEKYIYHLVVAAKIVQRIHVDYSRNGKSVNEPRQEKHRKGTYVPVGQKRLFCASVGNGQK